MKDGTGSCRSCGVGCQIGTHFRKYFDDVLGKREAAKLLRRVQFHYTPKHASGF